MDSINRIFVLAMASLIAVACTAPHGVGSHATGAGGGAGGSTSPPTTEQPSGGGGQGGATCGDVETTVFAAHCGQCHGANHPADGLDLVSPGLAARVVGQQGQEACAGILANPDHPEQSALYTKLLDPPGCGERMPIGADPLSADEIGCVKDWIAAQ